MNHNDICIKTTGLNKTFGAVHAVCDLNLEIHHGTLFGFLGPNGAGKTTTVRMLTGLMIPTSGIASVCGLDVSDQGEEVKALTGLLPESPGIYSKLSAVEFLEFVGVLHGCVGERLHNRIDKLLGILGLESRQDDLLESYSSGMKQKVLVASTLLHDPQVVFLDEPTSRLDPAASALVKDLIQALADETGTTFFICTHQTTFANELCDTIGILNQGQLIWVGPPQAIISQTKASNLEEAYLNMLNAQVDRNQLLVWR